MNDTYKPTAEAVKQLREATGAGMIECRNALVVKNGDIDEAKAYLIERGQAALVKKAERTANEGLVSSYIHAGGRVGVLLEVNCETDFVARSERFGELVNDVALHIAALSPLYVTREAVEPSRIAELREEFREAAAGKPADVVEKIVEGKLQKWYSEHVLLDQTFVKDEDITIAGLLGSVAAALGENIRIRRFAKFRLGDA